MDPLLEDFRKEICESKEIIQATNDLNWFELSIGWFLAKGVDIDRAWDMAREVRYTYGYWLS